MATITEVIRDDRGDGLDVMLYEGGPLYIELEDDEVKTYRFSEVDDILAFIEILESAVAELTQAGD